jgi:citrate lyase subunit beta/citryl-CoA lyase
VLPRSALYVPGDRPDRFAKALASGADAVILDLEDAVAPDAKARAREAVAAFLAAEGGPPGAELWVRLNAGAARERDVAAVAGAVALTGVCPAKAEDRGELDALDALLRAHGAGDGVLVEPLLESAAALFAARELAAAPRVRRLQLGEADLAADLGATPGPGDAELLWARSVAVAASAAAGAQAPLGPVSVELRDLAAFRASTEAVARLGFGGRACIHPAQVTVVNAVFTPDDERVAWARDVLARLEAAGGGVATGADGRMLDEAVARAARRVLARAPGPQAG